MILQVDGKRNSLSCKLKAGVECSPSVGPCCTDQCSFIPQSHKEKCKEEQVTRATVLIPISRNFLNIKKISSANI